MGAVDIQVLRAHQRQRASHYRILALFWRMCKTHPPLHGWPGRIFDALPRGGVPMYVTLPSSRRGKQLSRKSRQRAHGPKRSLSSLSWRHCTLALVEHDCSQECRQSNPRVRPPERDRMVYCRSVPNFRDAGAGWDLVMDVMDGGWWSRRALAKVYESEGGGVRSGRQDKDLVNKW